MQPQATRDGGLKIQKRQMKISFPGANRQTSVPSIKLSPANNLSDSSSNETAIEITASLQNRQTRI